MFGRVSIGWGNKGHLPPDLPGSPDGTASRSLAGNVWRRYKEMSYKCSESSAWVSRFEDDTKADTKSRTKCCSVLWGRESFVCKCYALNELMFGKEKSRTREN